MSDDGLYDEDADDYDAYGVGSEEDEDDEEEEGDLKSSAHRPQLYLPIQTFASFRGR